VVKVGLKRWGNAFVLSPHLCLPLPPLGPLFLPLRSRASQLVGLRNAVSSPSGVWGGAPAEIEFGAF